MMPITLMAIVVGIIFGFRDIQRSSSHFTSPLTFYEVLQNLKSFFGHLFPFFLVLVFTLYFKLHLTYSLILAILALVLFHRPSITLVLRLGKASFSWEIVFLIWGIMTFKEILTTSGAMEAIVREFAEIGLPSLVLIIVLPAILGIITGYSNALVGLSFPIFAPFFKIQESGLSLG